MNIIHMLSSSRTALFPKLPFLVMARRSRPRRRSRPAPALALQCASAGSLQALHAVDSTVHTHRGEDYLLRKGQLNRDTRYRPATTSLLYHTKHCHLLRKGQLKPFVAKGSVESTHKVPTSHLLRKGQLNRPFVYSLFTDRFHVTKSSNVALLFVASAGGPSKGALTTSMVNRDMQPTPLAATKFAEEQLNALLDEAYAAHEAVGRLVNNRPSIAYGTTPAPPPAPLPLPLPTPTLPTPMLGSGRQTPLPDGSFKRAGIFGVQGVSMTPQLVPSSMIPAEVASLPAQLMALQRRVDELGSSQQQQQHQHQHQRHQQHEQHEQHQHQHQQYCSSIAVPSSVEDGTARGTAARLTSAARASRTNARLGQDLAAARATLIELELENTALRTALDRHRTAMREDATLRSQLEEARRARAAAEHAKNAEARQCDELRFQLRQAEAESERLRTLLAGTIWFDMKT